jgi:hypothetical protein
MLSNDLGIGFRVGRARQFDRRARKPVVRFVHAGPPLRGGLFETTAVPEIRLRAAALAKHLMVEKVAVEMKR